MSLSGDLTKYLEGLSGQLNDMGRFDEKGRLYTEAYRADLGDLFRTYGDKYMSINTQYGDVVKSQGGLSTGRVERDFSNARNMISGEYASGIGNISRQYRQQQMGLAEERSNFIQNLNQQLYAALSGYKSATGKSFKGDIATNLQNEIEDSLFTLRTGEDAPARPPRPTDPLSALEEWQSNGYYKPPVGTL